MTSRRRADFHQGLERKMKLLKQAEYMAAAGFYPPPRQSPFARGWVHIRLHKRVSASLDALRNALVASTAIIGIALLATDLNQIDSRAAKETATAIATARFSFFVTTHLHQRRAQILDR